VSRGLLGVVDGERTVEGGGFVVTRPFPTRLIDHFDPFLLLDQMGPVEVPPGQAKGAPNHPHRGFETVTYVLDGAFEHKDSAGNHGRLGPGDVQWMTAGDGIVHDEMPAKEILEKGGRMFGFQLWVNLPRRDKRMRPRYQEIPASRIPTAERDGVKARVIAGESLGAKAVIETRTPITYLHLTLAPGARIEQPIPRSHNAFAWVFGGEARVADRVVKPGQAALLAQDGDSVVVSSETGAEVLLLSGEPLREPVARWGPFVMNTREELVEAVHDYQNGRMGRLPGDL